MAVIIRGMETANAIKEDLKIRVSLMNGVLPCLATVRVGDDPYNIAYENSLEKTIKNVGFKMEKIVLNEHVSESELLWTVKKLNEDGNIHGILIFRPLPKHFDLSKISALVATEKDVDCMNPANIVKLLIGDKSGYAPCTAQAVVEIFDFLKMDLRGKRVVIIGRSMVVGKPLGLMLLERDATVTWCHSRTENIPAMCKDADVIIVAVGRPYFLKEDYVKDVADGCVIIDVGINEKPNGDPGICGDVDFEAVQKYVGAITPVPGGVGSVTGAVMAKQVFNAAFNLTNRTL